jgi:uncharacterized protein (TIGR02099 family)
MLLKILRISNRLLWGSLTVFLVALATVVSLGRYYMPDLGRYQHQILSEIRSRVDLQFEVGSIEGEWRGLSPVVRIRNFRLMSPAGDTVVEADYLAVYFDLVESLFFRSVLAETVSLVDAEVQLAESADGSWGLRGIDGPQDAGGSGAALVRFFEKLDLLELTNVRVGATAQDRRSHSIEQLSLVLRQGLYLSQLNLELGEPDEEAGLRLVAEFEGWLDEPLAFKGYLELKQWQLDKLAPYLGQWQARLPAALSGKLWLDWSHGGDLQASGTLATSDWTFGALSGVEPPGVEALGLDFLLTREPGGAIDGWVQQLGFQWTGVNYQFNELEFSLTPAMDTLAVQLDAAAIEPLTQGLLSSGLLPAALVEVLETLQPAGSLRNIFLDIPLHKQRAGDFRIRANVAGARLQSWKGAPGATSIDGYVEAGLLQGFVDLDGSYLELEFPGLYDEKLVFDGVDARVGWQVGERVLVNSGLIRLHGDFGRGTAQLDLDIPRLATEDDAPSMSLMIGLEDTDAGYRNRYIPMLLGENLRDWLDKSIEAADVDQLGFIYSGALAAPNPLDKTVQLFLDARNGRLRYQPEWPVLEKIEAQVVLADDYLMVTAPSAMTLDTRLTNVRVDMSTRDKLTWLDIVADAEGPAGDLIQLFRESPLRAATGGAFDKWVASGRYSAGLDLRIPIGGGQAPVLAVDGQLQQLDLDNPGLALNFTDIEGDLSYRSADGITARRIDGKLWGEPLRASIFAGEQTASGNKPLVLLANGDVAVEGLQRWLGFPALSLASGKTAMQAEVTIVPVDDKSIESNIRIRSDLVGVALELPEPFAKPAAQSRMLQYDLSLARPGYSELYVAEMLSACVDVRGDEPRAGIRIGRGATPELPAAGVLINGALRQADLGQWLDALAKYEPLAGDIGPTVQFPLRIEKLPIAEFRLFGEWVQGAVLDAAMVDRRWQFKISHPRIQGSVTLPGAGQKLALKFERLLLPLTDKRSGRIVGAGLAAVDPGGLPAASVQVKQFSVGELDLGSWSFSLEPIAGGVAASNLRIDVSGATFAGVDVNRGAQLRWTANGKAHRSELQGMLRTGNLDELFSHWGYSTGVVSKSAQVGVDLYWDYPPDRIAVPVIAGDLRLDLRDGQLLQTSGTAADALKLVGILNINNLARRLRLDFSDLYKKGISYDRIMGEIQLDRGQLSFPEPLSVRGPSSRLKLSGNFDLNRGDIDAKLVVALPITSNLPWVVALTLPGGLPLAAGVFVAGKVFEKELEKLTSAVYEVTGTLDKPSINFKRLVETGASRP